jgi:hypothetical protein
LEPGSFTIHEDLDAACTIPLSQCIRPAFTGDCKQTGPDSPDATGTISAGQTLHCTITNTPAGTLFITKLCPGCAGLTQPTITVTGNNPQPPSFNIDVGVTRVVTLRPGSFTITESLPPGFSAPTFSGDCTTSTGTISAGQALSCIITNHQEP